MTKKELLNEYYYEKLTKSHDLSNFSCGVKDLDAFLKEDALIQQEKKLNVTYLAIRKNEILGFISISADNIRCRDINNKNRYNQHCTKRNHCCKEDIKSFFLYMILFWSNNF